MQTVAFVAYRYYDAPHMSDQISLWLFQHYQQVNVTRGYDALPLNAYDSAPLLHSLRASNTLFVIVGPRWLEARNEVGQRRIDQPTDLVHAAIAIALRERKLIIPILVEGAQMPPVGALPPDIAAFSYQQAKTIHGPSSLAADLAGITGQIAGQYALTRKVLPLVLIGLLLFQVLSAVLVPALLAGATQTNDVTPIYILDGVELVLFMSIGLAAISSAFCQQRWQWFTALIIPFPLALAPELFLVVADFFPNSTLFQMTFGFAQPVQLLYCFLLIYFARGSGRIIIERMPIAMRRDNKLWQTYYARRRSGLSSAFFISYRHDDSARMTDRIYQALVKRYRPGRVFRDINSILAGADFVAVLQRALDSTNTTLVIIGPHWLELRDAHGRRRIDDPHDFVRLEVATALHQRTPGKLVLALLVDGATMPKTSDLPPDLAELAACPSIIIRDDPYFVVDMRSFPQRILNLYTPFARPRPAIIWGGRVMAVFVMIVAVLDDKLTQQSPIFGVLIGAATTAFVYTFSLAAFEAIRDNRWGWLGLLCAPVLIEGYSVWAFISLSIDNPYLFQSTTIPFLIIISALLEALLLLLFGHGTVTIRIEDSAQSASRAIL